MMGSRRLAVAATRVVLRPRASGLAASRRAYHAPVRDMRFQLYSVHEFEKHYEALDSEVECDRDTMDMVIDESAKLCENELAPLTAAADREGKSPATAAAG